MHSSSFSVFEYTYSMILCYTDKYETTKKYSKSALYRTTGYVDCITSSP